MVVKKYKRNRQEGAAPPGRGGANNNQGNIVTIKEPFYYNEDVSFDFYNMSNLDYKVYSFRPLE